MNNWRNRRFRDSVKRQVAASEEGAEKRCVIFRGTISLPDREQEQRTAKRLKGEQVRGRVAEGREVNSRRDESVIDHFEDLQSHFDQGEHYNLQVQASQKTLGCAQTYR